MASMQSLASLIWLIVVLLGISSVLMYCILEKIRSSFRRSSTILEMDVGILGALHVTLMRFFMSRKRTLGDSSVYASGQGLWSYFSISTTHLCMIVKCKNFDV